MFYFKLKFLTERTAEVDLNLTWTLPRNCFSFMLHFPRRDAPGIEVAFLKLSSKYLKYLKSASKMCSFQFFFPRLYLDLMALTLLVYISVSMEFFQKQPPGVAKDILENFAKFIGKYPCRSLFLINLFTNLLRQDSSTYVFLCFFLKFLRTPFLQSTSVGCFCSMQSGIF